MPAPQRSGQAVPVLSEEKQRVVADGFEVPVVGGQISRISLGCCILLCFQQLAAFKEPLGRPVLQQARHGGAMDQGRQAGDPLDAVVVPSVPGERSAPATERNGLQPGQPLAQADPAAGDQALVADESPAAAGENRRPAGEARQILLAPAGGRSSEPAALRRDAAEDLGATGAGRLTPSATKAGEERTKVWSGV